ncbi:hypothetical protein ACFP4H_00985 [Pseudophaeobacter arcticus]|jgi:hypothetical protein|uniref:hypothetical protein n=1 Tax=Pseudophaeobacter arcticus TaxID=385492 RepID=UPI00042A6C86|nr:hypothetical protein [Pseudophaeobacter arcticus]
MAQSGAYGGKILSCCYCGVQSRFLPGHSGGAGGGLSALVCGTCGAPLSSQKARPLAPGKGACLPGAVPGWAAVAPTRPGGKKTKGTNGKNAPRKITRGKKIKKRKGLFQSLLSEAVDLVEDIFD